MSSASCDQFTRLGYEGYQEIDLHMQRTMQEVSAGEQHRQSNGCCWRLLDETSSSISTSSALPAGQPHAGCLCCACVAGLSCSTLQLFCADASILSCLAQNPTTRCQQPTHLRQVLLIADLYLVYILAADACDQLKAGLKALRVCDRLP